LSHRLRCVRFYSHVGFLTCKVKPNLHLRLNPNLDLDQPAGTYSGAAEKVGAGRGGRTPVEQAMDRASVSPLEARAEVEREAVAAAARRVARILRENCALIAGVHIGGTAKGGSESKSQNLSGGDDESKKPPAESPTTEGGKVERQRQQQQRQRQRQVESPLPSPSPLPAWLTAVARGAVVCPVGPTMHVPARPEAIGGTGVGVRLGGVEGAAAGEARRASAMSADQAAVEGWSGAPQVVELTVEGLKGFKVEARVDDGSGGDDGSDGGASGCGNGGDNDTVVVTRERQLKEAVRAFDDVLPHAGVGSEPLAVVLPPRPPHHALGEAHADLEPRC